MVQGGTSITFVDAQSIHTFSASGNCRSDPAELVITEIASLFTIGGSDVEQTGPIYISCSSSRTQLESLIVTYMVQ